MVQLSKKIFFPVKVYFFILVGNADFQREAIYMKLQKREKYLRTKRSSLQFDRSENLFVIRKMQKKTFQTKREQAMLSLHRMTVKGFWGLFYCRTNAAGELNGVFIRSSSTITVNKCGGADRWIYISMLFTFANYGGIPQCTVGLVLYPSSLMI